jgi:hypothetical protein
MACHRRRRRVPRCGDRPSVRSPAESSLRRPPLPGRACRRVCRPDTNTQCLGQWTTSVVMNIVPPPRSSYVRVRRLGGPPVSYFDVCGFNIQTPTNGSRVCAAAGRGFVVAVVTVAGLVVGLGRVGFCWASERPDHRTIDVARESSNRRRDSGIDRLQSRKPLPCGQHRFAWQTSSCMCRAGFRPRGAS